MASKMFRLSGENELVALQRRMGYRDSGIQPSTQAQYGRRGEMIDTRPYEVDVQKVCLDVLELHPRVRFFWRANTGGFRDAAGFYVKMNFTGCSDILGMLVDSRFLAIECKRPGEEPTDDQAEFLWKVWNAGGCAFVATDANDIFRNIPR